MKIFKKNISFNRYIAILLTFAILFALTSCASKNTEEEAKYEQGEEAKEYAYDFVRQFPHRTSFSDEEKKAADWLQIQLKNLGYDPQVEEFKSASASSQNVYIKIDGRSFIRTKEDIEARKKNSDYDELKEGEFRKTLVIVANYDTPSLDSLSLSKGDSDYQGIHNNGAAVGTLLELAKNLKNKVFGYDIYLAFIGASNNTDNGVKTLYNRLENNGDLSNVSCVIELNNILAGEKLYAHSGQYSTKHNEKYNKRLDLYLLIDLFLYNRIYYKYDVNILTNVNNFEVNVPLTSQNALYREFSLRKSSYSYFDAKGINCIFIDSGNYELEKNADEFKENTASIFDEYQGRISATVNDNIKFLTDNLPDKQLEKRSQALVSLLSDFIETGDLTARIK